MVTGLNQNVDVLGRVFHVQTELTTGDEPKIRTLVFMDGRIIGSREKLVDDEECAEDQLREQIKVQHNLIIDNFLSRAEALQAKQQAEAPAEPAAQTMTGRNQPPSKMAPRPELNEDPKLDESVRVRRLHGRFRANIDLTRPEDLEAVRARLKSTLKNIRMVMDDPSFPDVRLDEQVGFYDLKHRIIARLGDMSNHEAALSMWGEVARFTTYLGRISNRKELVIFDRKLLSWALAMVGQQGPTDDVLAYLRNAYGRDVELDHLLDHPEGVGKQQWLELFMGLLDRTMGDDF